MGEVRMTGAKWDAQVRGAGKLPGRAMTSQAVQLPHREGGGAATAPFAPPDGRAVAWAATLDTCAQRLVRWPSALGCGPALALRGSGPGLRAAGGRQASHLAQVCDDRLVRTRRRVAAGAGGAVPRHRVDAAGRAGAWVVREDHRGREWSDDDRTTGARGGAGAGRVELPEELREGQRPPRSGVRRHQ